MQIEFVYFDLGNVLVSFDPEIACRNLSELAGISTDRAREVLYDSGLQDQYESGQITSRSFTQTLREVLDLDAKRLPQDLVLDAISDMFTPIDSMVQVVELARRSAGRVGVLSNTCPAHWRWVRKQPWPVSQIDYDVKILSCEVMSMKPDMKIYEAAEKAARVRPERILFIDDKPENVRAAAERGWRAHQCLGGEQAKSVIEQHLGVK
ncbi:HAD family hydrolase [Stieleria sp.]|uniref:HAD family hydrolase n=1 Tax=Stieleria sp. TaxID=2795976 RepID=UPI0035675B5D